jgi:hypothetical protein
LSETIELLSLEMDGIWRGFHRELALPSTSNEKGTIEKYMSN